MPKSFSVTTDQTNLSLVSERKGEAVFTVTNTTDRPRRAQLYLKPQGNTKESWFQVGGEMTREFSAKETHSVTVRAVIPNETPQGSYPFRLIVALDSDPDDVTEGPQVTIQVPKISDDEPPWRKILMIIGIVCVVGLVGWQIWEKYREVEIPDTKGLKVDIAKQKLEALGFVLGQNKEVLVSEKNIIGDVVDFEPKTIKPRGAEVVLTVNVKGVVVPPLIGRTGREALQAIADTNRENKSFLSVVPLGNPENWGEKNVVSVTPPAGDLVPPKGVIKIQMPGIDKPWGPGHFGGGGHLIPAVLMNLLIPTEEQNCFDQVQGKIAWDQKGSKEWDSTNVARLCKGTTNASQRISCFEGKIKTGKGWDEAIRACAQNP